MSSQRDLGPTPPAAPASTKVSVGQFAERFKSQVIPLSTTFGYYCASLPMSEEVVKEYLEEPVAALPPTLTALLPHISILLVPYLERCGERGTGTKRKSRTGVEKTGDFVVSERPVDNRQSWASQVSFENETVLVFALKEQDVAEYHYRLYRRLSALVAESWSKEACAGYREMVREELAAGVHGEVDDESWQAKQNLLRRQTNVKRDSPSMADYLRQSFIDTLTLYLHGICCDIDVETGPRQLPSRYLRKRLQLLKSLYPPPPGYAIFPEDHEQAKLAGKQSDGRLLT